ncbi:MAG: antibiotic biosynthesis monooxygenase family protein [Pseudomonadota bacterium]
MDERARAVITTTVSVKPGHLEAIADLFAETNPPLVATHPDWLQAVFSADIDTNAVTVVAYWTTADAYLAFSASDAFKETMRLFAPHLEAPPVVSLSHVLVGMTRDTLWRVPVPTARQSSSSPETV